MLLAFTLFRPRTKPSMANVFALIGALGVGAVLSTTISFAQSADPAWMDELREQLARQEQCEVGYYVSTREDTVGGKPSFEATVQCEDGRRFDASRIGRDVPFEIRMCEVQTC